MKAVNLSEQLKNFLRNEPAKETRIMLAQKRKVFKEEFEFPRFAVVGENFWCKMHLVEICFKIPTAF